MAFYSIIMYLKIWTYMKKKYVAEFQLPDNGIRQLLNWHGLQLVIFITSCTNSLQQQLQLTGACSWASLLNPWVWQVFCAKHAPLHLSSSLSCQAANEGHCYIVFHPLCSLLPHPVYSKFPSPLERMLLHNVKQHSVNVTWRNVTKHSCTQRKRYKT